MEKTRPKYGAVIDIISAFVQNLWFDSYFKNNGDLIKLANFLKHPWPPMLCATPVPTIYVF
jgi:hypothetical protein